MYTDTAFQVAVQARVQWRHLRTGSPTVVGRTIEPSNLPTVNTKINPTAILFCS